MQLNPGLFDDKLSEYLDQWTPERIKTMNINDYTDLSNHDSLCYSLEYGTKELGQIGGTALHKFELWAPKEEREFKDDRFAKDGAYIWAKKWGNTSYEAFEKIRQIIVDIVTHSLNDEWEKVEQIKFHSLAKWKIAFLYSNKKLFPVYSRRALQEIAKGLGKTFNKNDRILDIQLFIIEQKPSLEDMVEYAHRTFTLFAEIEKQVSPSYYLIGSKYGGSDENHSIDVMPEFLKRSCVSIGFIDWIDFSSQMGNSRKSVDQWVEEYIPNNVSSLRDTKSYFRHLSQMKVGDIIAVKSHGSFGKLTIIAYARVVEKNGSIYEYDEGDLGHCIHVEFLEAGIERQLGLNYAKTIHHLKEGGSREHFNLIFGWYGSMANELEKNMDNQNYDEETIDETTKKGYNKKEETSYQRSPIASVMVKRLHNRIQNLFVPYLENIFPEYEISGEKQYIDVIRENNEEQILYEIKPFSSPYACIINGIGQLLGYWHNSRNKKKKSIVIVGPNEPNDSDMHFINSLKEKLDIPFSYIAFDANSQTSKEF
ncbi:hypothetical protein [Sediminibacterium sp.]|uniref:hypothetical protein n=1 Tax=Sediminibacterium sp. TaxID=1917865 RepID=UPI002734CB53|nr:hypothetical protein [Sediminibacterium sp.]MDP3393866.1 hypothetical protein [Sediminibacterium sp.]MDP3568804.1 hypothetical protein [Sediminibacterium sp.]